jgi:hypothetical protein
MFNCDGKSYSNAKLRLQKKLKHILDNQNFPRWNLSFTRTKAMIREKNVDGQAFLGTKLLKLRGDTCSWKDKVFFSYNTKLKYTVQINSNHIKHEWIKRWSYIQMKIVNMMKNMEHLELWKIDIV